MKYKVNAETLERTVKCKYDFSCLHGKKECLCDVNKSIDDRLILVDPQSNEFCNYLLSFGKSYICNCPVRTEIYKKYKA